jgi:hypothetical protein
MRTPHDFCPGKPQTAVIPQTGTSVAAPQARTLQTQVVAEQPRPMPPAPKQAGPAGPPSHTAGIAAKAAVVNGQAASATARRTTHRKLSVFYGDAREGRVPRSRTRWASTPQRYNAWMLLRMAYTGPLMLECATAEEANVQCGHLRSGLVLMEAGRAVRVTTRDRLVIITVLDLVRLTAAISAWLEALRVVDGACPVRTDPARHDLLVRMTPAPGGCGASLDQVRWAADFAAGMLAKAGTLYREHTDERAAAQDLEQVVCCLRQTGWYPKQIVIDHYGRHTRYTIIRAGAAERIQHERTALAIMQRSMRHA